MANSLDLNLLPIVRQAGQDQAEALGLYLGEPPRRAARGRSDDHLILYLAMVGNAPLSPGKQEQILAQLAKTYFDTAGSVTAALRTVAEALNHFLLDRNVRSASTGRQALGLLSLMVLRGETIYLAQSGPVHAFFLTAERVEHLYDIDMAGRGLGLSRATPVRFHQAELHPNDTILLAAQPSPTWSPSTLAGAHGQGPESLRRRLLDRNILDLNAVLVQARPGKGKLNLARPARASQPAAGATVVETDSGADRQPDLERKWESPPGPANLPSQAVPASPPAAPVEAPALPAEPLNPTVGKPEPSPLPPTPPPAAPGLETPPETLPTEPGPASTPPEVAGLENGDETAVDVQVTLNLEDLPPWEALPPASEAAPRQAPSFAASQPRPLETPVPGNTGPQPASAPSRPRGKASKAAEATTGALTSLGGAMAGTAGAAGRGLKRAIKAFLLRLIPDEEWQALPGPTLALVAIAVPLVVVLVASMVYFKRGQELQCTELRQRLNTQIEQALAQNDVLMRRTDWLAALDTIDQARFCSQIPEVISLRGQIQASLDAMDLVRRANYQPAIIGGLTPDVQVTRMVVSSNDLYMLDSTTGNVLRAIVTNSGSFETDNTFQCGPGQGDPKLTGALIDLVAWPAGNKPEAAVLALDANGILLFCSPGQPPTPVNLAPPPSLQLSNLKSFTLDVTDLYVLDPQGNAVWIYWNTKFGDQPEFYFSEQVPPLNDVVDLAVNNDELYLLHADGHLTLCFFGGLGVTPTRCTDPSPYIDSRQGQENTTLTPVHPFRQILFNPPPDPSLYFLEPDNKAIYHFSLRNLAYQRQYLPLDPARLGETPATAFTVNALERTLYLAVGHDVYYAAMP